MSPTATPATGPDRAAHPSARTDRRRPRRVHAPIHLGLLLVVTCLTLLGLVMVLSASSVTDLTETGSAWFSFKRQSAFAVLGAAALLVTRRTDYHHVTRWSTPLLIGTLVLLGLVLVPGVGVNVNGSSRWLAAGPVRVQPGELAKLATICWAAALLARRWDLVRVPRATLRPALLALGGVAALLLLQPNLGTTIVVAAAVLTLLFVAGVPTWQVAGVSTLAAGAAAALSLFEGYRRARVFAFLDPWADPLNSGYQTIQSLVGIASGGLTGVGLGASRAKWGFLPYAHTDFIFAIVAEELGLVGAVTVLALFVALGVLGLRIASRAPDPLGMLLAVGITTWFVVQAAVNIGAAVGLLPITGVPLPFVSAGGSALVVNLAATGILLNIADQAPLGSSV